MNSFMWPTVIVGLILALGIAAIIAYEPSVEIGQHGGEVVLSAIRETPKGRKIHRLEVRLASGREVSVRTHSSRTLEPGQSITVVERRSWLGQTFYRWSP